MATLNIIKAVTATLTDKELPPLSPGKIRIMVQKVGICGSDLHYYFEGRCGNFIINSPLTPGHEFSGTITEINANTTLKIGDRVAINPSHICHTCPQCIQEKNNLCEHNTFFGTASTQPHTQGAMTPYVDIYPEQCFLMNQHTSFEEGACAEPLAVAMHAITRIDEYEGKHILVLGSGTIGCLITQLLTIHHVKKLVVTDLEEQPLKIAAQMGATTTINVMKDKAALKTYVEQQGKFDTVFEVTGNISALNDAFTVIKRGGNIVQVGGIADYTKATGLNYIMANEIRYIGSMRFTEEDYIKAIELINTKKVNLKPILTRTFSIKDYKQAFDLAKDKTQSIKVHLDMVN